MKKVLAVSAVLALLCLGSIAQADVFHLGSAPNGTVLTNLETVTVGNRGNVGELSGAGAGGFGDDRICGSVSYTYNIGKYEVTAAQYTNFLNNKAKVDEYGLYNSSMWTDPYGCKIQQSGTSGNYSYTVASDWANRPVNFVSYWSACRFANWLGNGQGENGDTEIGAYTLNGYNGDDGGDIQRNAGWTWAVTSEDEWYKAAYYKGGGTNAGYWDYPTGTNAMPSNVGSDGYVDPGNHANCGSIGSPYYRTNVGEFEKSGSPYGTFDQGGNVWEWNESIKLVSGISGRGMRGGSFSNSYGSLWASARFDFAAPSWVGPYPNPYLGFRLVAVPEPSSIIALASGLVCLVGVRRRRA